MWAAASTASARLRPRLFAQQPFEQFIDMRAGVQQRRNARLCLMQTEVHRGGELLVAGLGQERS